jgi:hypothetical protein
MEELIKKISTDKKAYKDFVDDLVTKAITDNEEFSTLKNKVDAELSRHINIEILVRAFNEANAEYQRIHKKAEESR